MRSNTGILNILLLAVSVVGCVRLEPETVHSDGDRRIDFPTPLVGHITRTATGGRTDYPESETFGVFGLYYPAGDFSGWENTPESSLYINGAEFKYSNIDDSTDGSGAWISDPIYYWQKNGKMAFAAWSPYNAKDNGTLTYGSTGLSVDGFSTGSNGDCDLMYSERVYDKSSSIGDNSKYDGIDIVFHHALSSLRFKTAASCSTAKIAVSRVVIWGLYREGDFNENVDENVPGSYVSSPEWTSLSDSYSKSDSLVVKGDGSMDAFIIPQEISVDAKMKVYYTVRIGDSNPVPTVSQEIGLSGNKIHGTDTEIEEWKMATRYVYTLAFTDLYQIKFSVDVRDWCDSNVDD